MYLRRIPDRRSVLSNEVLSRSVVHQFPSEREVRIWRAGNDGHARLAAVGPGALPAVQHHGTEAGPFLLPPWNEWCREPAVRCRSRTTGSVIEPELLTGLSK